MNPNAAPNPMTYRALLKQRGEQLLAQLTEQGKQQSQEPVIPLPTATPPTPTDTTSAQLGGQNDLMSNLKNYFSAQSLAPNSTGQGMIGPEPQNALSALKNVGSQAFNEFCQKFVEQATLGHSGVFPSAIAAWQAQQDKAKPGFDGIQPGDLVYFGADQSNQNAGHTGIYTGNGNFVSATDNGVKQVPLANWMQSTGQRYLGYIPRASVSDPAGHGAAGKGGGNPLEGLANYVKNGMSHVWEGMQGKPDGTQGDQPETFGHMVGSYLSGFTPEGAGADIARNALGTALQTSGATAHVGAMLPMVAGALRDAAPEESAAVHVSSVPGIKYLPIDQVYDPERGIDPNRIAQNVALAKQGGEIPPLLVNKDANGFAAMDGRHRLEAFRQLGQKFVPTINMSNPNPDTLNAYNNVLDQANAQLKGIKTPTPAPFTVPYWGSNK